MHPPIWLSHTRETLKHLSAVLSVAIFLQVFHPGSYDQHVMVRLGLHLSPQERLVPRLNLALEGFHSIESPPPWLPCTANKKVRIFLSFKHIACFHFFPSWTFMCVCMPLVPQRVYEGQRTTWRCWRSCSAMQVCRFRTQIVRLGCRYFYLLSHITGLEHRFSSSVRCSLKIIPHRWNPDIKIQTDYKGCQAALVVTKWG